MKNFETILETAEACFELDKGVLLGRNRDGNTARVRQSVMYYLRKNTELTLPQIGRLFERDHTTALYSNNKVDSLLRTNKEFRKQYIYLDEILKYMTNGAGKVFSPPPLEDVIEKSTRGEGMTICGWGINDAKREDKGTVVLNRWMSMIQRCHGLVKESHERLVAEVCEDWRHFTRFKKWFDENITHQDDQLDKDILNRHNEVKRYSPETCLLVPHSVNSTAVFSNFGVDYEGHCTVRERKIDRYRFLVEQYKEEYPEMAKHLNEIIKELEEDGKHGRWTVYPV